MTTVGMVLFPRLTQLDATGPYEVLARLPDTRVLLVAARSGPVASDSGLVLVPDGTFAESPDFDILCVPGGNGVNDMLEDDEFLDFLRRQGERARYVTAVCTGALLLGAAGLLRGYRATTHWLSLDLLRLQGAEPVAERVVVDRNRITGGGVTAGIDFGLELAAELCGVREAEKAQLYLQYAPAPPFSAGHPGQAPGDIVNELRARSQENYDARERLLREVVLEPR